MIGLALLPIAFVALLVNFIDEGGLERLAKVFDWALFLLGLTLLAVFMGGIA